MPRMTPSELYAYEAKRAQRQPALIPNADDAEADLHDFIIGWCRRQDPLVPYGHARMDKKSGYTVGFPDFVLLLPHNKTVLIECKTQAGTLSDEQTEFIGMAARVQHTIHICRSIPEFLEIVKQC